MGCKKQCAENAPSFISRHIRNVDKEKELSEKSAIAFFATVQEKELGQKRAVRNFRTTRMPGRERRDYQGNSEPYQ